jgi:hypothetical protein
MAAFVAAGLPPTPELTPAPDAKLMVPLPENVSTSPRLTVMPVSVQGWFAATVIAPAGTTGAASGDADVIASFNGRR